MKPTQEQVIAWAQAVGMERCNCEPRCHLHTGGMGSLTALVDLAYEAGRKDEVNRIVNLMMIQHEAAKERHNYWHCAANLIQAEVASDT